MARLWLLSLGLAFGNFSIGVVAQDPDADDLNADMTDNVLLQGPPDLSDDLSTNKNAASPANKNTRRSKASIERLSADMDAISDKTETDAVVQEASNDIADEAEGRRAVAAALGDSAVKAKAARIEKDELNSRHTYMADAGAFNVAKDEISRAKAENAAALVEKAVVSKKRAQKQAAYLKAVAEGYRKQEADALKKVEVVATQAARRAASQFRREHMKKAKLLEAQSWKASQLASETRAAADAAVKRAFAGLANVQSS